jgi:hypothetical protein
MRKFILGATLRRIYKNSLVPRKTEYIYKKLNDFNPITVLTIFTHSQITTLPAPFFSPLSLFKKLPKTPHKSPLFFFFPFFALPTLENAPKMHQNPSNHHFSGSKSRARPAPALQNAPKWLQNPLFACYLIRPRKITKSPNHKKKKKKNLKNAPKPLKSPLFRLQIPRATRSRPLKTPKMAPNPYLRAISSPTPAADAAARRLKERQRDEARRLGGAFKSRVAVAETFDGGGVWVPPK